MIDLQIEAPAHRMIAAPTGGGKSYFVGYMVEQLYEHQIPFIIFDTKTENHIGLQALPDLVVVDINPRNKGKYDLKTLIDYNYILCVPANRDIDLSAILDVYRDILYYIWLHDHDTRVLICEEAHNWNKNSSVPDPLFEKVAREGRGAKKYIWFVTQRLQNFNQLLWSQCKYTYVFGHITHADIRYIAAMIPDFENKERGGQVVKLGLNSQLQDHDLIVWDGRQAQIIRHDDYKRRTEHVDRG